jgi:signal transduction histidine kinase
VASNNSGRWSETEAVQELIVAPWFYQTWWFYSAAAAAAGLTLAAAHVLRLRRTRRRFAAILDERTRIARELHDTLAQGLAVVGLQLDALAAHLPPSPAVAVSRHLDHARRQIRSSLVEARRSVWDLRAPSVDEWELCAALAALAREVGETGALECRFRGDGEPSALGESARRHLYRIAQEAVSNVVRHARARRVEVALQSSPVP